MAGIVDLILEVALDHSCIDKTPTILIEELSIYLLHTVGQCSNADVVERLSKYLDYSKKKNRIRLAETSASRSSHATSFQHLLALKMGELLVGIILSKQIKSPDELYPHVIQAINGLQYAFCGQRCIIGGELINVAGVKDEFVVAPCGVLEHDGKDGSTSACLYNLRGSTSYLTGTLQCFRCVPELKSALMKWRPLFETSRDHFLTAATRDLFKQLDKNAEPVAPRLFLQLFEEKYCTTQGKMNNDNSEDAEACWVQLLDTLSWSFKSPSSPSEKLDIVSDLFDIKLASSVHCQESGEKPREERFVRMLEWHVSSMVCSIQDGLKDFLESGLGEASSLSIYGLPRYLTIRFIHKNERPNYKVNLLEVDVSRLCSDELRVKLEAARVNAKKCSSLKDQDAEVGSSNGSGDLCKTTREEGVVSGWETQLTGFYRLVACLAYSESPHHFKIKSAGQYCVYVKPTKKSRKGELSWFHYLDENCFYVRPKDVGQIMRGGYGTKPYICLYKADVLKQESSAQVVH